MLDRKILAWSHSFKRERPLSPLVGGGDARKRCHALSPPLLTHELLQGKIFLGNSLQFLSSERETGVKSISGCHGGSQSSAQGGAGGGGGGRSGCVLNPPVGWNVELVRVRVAPLNKTHPGAQGGLSWAWGSKGCMKEASITRFPGRAGWRGCPRETSWGCGRKAAAVHPEASLPPSPHRAALKSTPPPGSSLPCC